MGLELPPRLRRIGLWTALSATLLLMGACSNADQEQIKRLAMPVPVTDRAPAIYDLWQGAWVAAILVGILVWGLIGYACFAFYRPQHDEIPVQTRYNLPIEILYTVAPIVMVLVFFYYTVDHAERGARRGQRRRGRPHRSRSSVSSGRGRSTTSRTRHSTADERLRGRHAGGPPDAGAAGRRDGLRSSSVRPTSSTRSGSRRSCSRWTSSRAVTTASRSPRPRGHVRRALRRAVRRLPLADAVRRPGRDRRRVRRAPAGPRGPGQHRHRSRWANADTQVGIDDEDASVQRRRARMTTAFEARRVGTAAAAATEARSVSRSSGCSPPPTTR